MRGGSSGWAKRICEEEEQAAEKSFFKIQQLRKSLDFETSPIIL